MPRVAGPTSTLRFCAHCRRVSKWGRAAWRAKAKVTTTAASNIRKEKATAIRVRSVRGSSGRRIIAVPPEKREEKDRQGASAPARFPADNLAPRREPHRYILSVAARGGKYNGRPLINPQRPTSRHAGKNH